MGYRRRRTSSLSRWIVGAIFLAVGVLAASTAVGWLQSRDGGGEDAGTASAADSTARLRSEVRVEVLNGAGESGAAERVARWVRDLGFDVVYFGNASHFEHGVTHVVDRSEGTDGARVLARALAVDSLSSDPAPELYLDATLVLGEDWRQRFPDAAAGRLPDLGPTGGAGGGPEDGGGG